MRRLSSVSGRTSQDGSLSERSYGMTSRTRGQKSGMPEDAARSIFSSFSPLNMRRKSTQTLASIELILPACGKEIERFSTAGQLPGANWQFSAFPLISLSLILLKFTSSCFRQCILGNSEKTVRPVPSVGRFRIFTLFRLFYAVNNAFIHSA